MTNLTAWRLRRHQKELGRRIENMERTVRAIGATDLLQELALYRAWLEVLEGAVRQRLGTVTSQSSR